jgi:hypothetical protein
VTVDAIQARKEYYRQYRSKNNEKLKEYMKNYREVNKDKVKKYMETYWDKKSNIQKEALK